MVVVVGEDWFLSSCLSSDAVVATKLSCVVVADDGLSSEGVTAEPTVGFALEVVNAVVAEVPPVGNGGIGANRVANSPPGVVTEAVGGWILLGVVNCGSPGLRDEPAAAEVAPAPAPTAPEVAPEAPAIVVVLGIAEVVVFKRKGMMEFGPVLLEGRDVGRNELCPEGKNAPVVGYNALPGRTSIARVNTGCWAFPFEVLKGRSPPKELAPVIDAMLCPMCISEVKLDGNEAIVCIAEVSKLVPVVPNVVAAAAAAAAAAGG